MAPRKQASDPSRASHAARRSNGAAPAPRRTVEYAPDPMQPQPAPQRSQRQRKRKKGGLRPAFVLIVVLVIAAIVAFGIVRGCTMGSSRPLLAAGEEVTVVIEEGSSANAIGQLLEEYGLVSRSSEFTDEVKRENADANLKPGTYILYETAVPNVEYFVQADPITFVVTADGEITVGGEVVDSITMLDLLTEAGENWYESEKNKGNTTPDEDEDQTEDEDKKEKQKKKKKSTTTTTKKTQKTTTKKSTGAKTADTSNAALPLAGCAAALAAVLYLFFDKKRRRG